MSDESKRVTIIQENGNWIVRVTCTKYSVQHAFETEKEARQYASQIVMEEPKQRPSIRAGRKQA